MEINFNGVDEVYYDSDALDGVYHKGQLVWPAPYTRQHTFRGLSATTPETFRVQVGDKIQFNEPVAGPDLQSWANARAGIFIMDKGNLVPVGTEKGMPGWALGPAKLDGADVTGVPQNARGYGLGAQFDTTSWREGVYYVLGGVNSDFKSANVQFIITVKQPAVPPDREYQLPDDPFNFQMQEIEVYKGQTIVFKYPKNPKNVQKEPAELGWRHLNFAYIDSGWTREAAFAKFTKGAVQVDAYGETAGYTMRFSLLGNKSADMAAAFNIGQYAKKAQDVLVTIRGDSTAEYIYVLAYNGNYGENYTKAGILYKLHVKDYVKPHVSVPRTLFQFDPSEALKYHWTDYVNVDMGVWTMPQYTLSHLSNLQVSRPTPSSLGDGMDVAVLYVTDNKGTVVGYPLASDDPGNSGALQPRYGGRWFLPDTVRAGDVLYVNIGPDAGYGVPSAQLNFT